jgi:iron(III) transport system permease protein
VAVLSTLLVVPLAYGYAAALCRVQLTHAPAVPPAALLPLLAPSLLPGISLVYLFGNQAC